MRKAERFRSPLASFAFTGQATEHTTVKWPIVVNLAEPYQPWLSTTCRRPPDGSAAAVYEL